MEPGPFYLLKGIQNAQKLDQSNSLQIVFLFSGFS